jgi:hypothetical protein
MTPKTIIARIPRNAAITVSMIPVITKSMVTENIMIDVSIVASMNNPLK